MMKEYSDMHRYLPLPVQCSCGKTTTITYMPMLGRYEAADPRWKFSIKTYGWTCGAEGHRQLSNEGKRDIEF